MLKYPYWYEFLPNKEPVMMECEDKNRRYECDLVVIGGGLSGLSCAYFSTLKGLKVIVIEARGLCDGATGRNGGHQWAHENSSDVEDSHETLCSKVEEYDRKILGEFMETLSDAWKSRIGWIKTAGIDACIEKVKTPHFEDYYDNVRKNHDTETCPVKFITQNLPGISVAGLEFNNAAQFIPGQLLLALAEKIQNRGGVIWTGIKARNINTGSINECLVEMENCNMSIDCKYVAHCWNGYGSAETFLPIRLQKHVTSVKGQVTCLRNDAVVIPKSLVYYSCDESTEEYLIQRPDKSIIFGGMRHLAPNLGVGLKDDNEPTTEVSEKLQKEFDRFFKTSKKSEITHAWSGVMCFTDDETPIVGKIEEFPNQYVSIGFCGHGMVRTFSCGQYLSELMTNSPISCDEIGKAFNPNRFPISDSHTRN